MFFDDSVQAWNGAIRFWQELRLIWHVLERDEVRLTANAMLPTDSYDSRKYYHLAGEIEDPGLFLMIQDVIEGIHWDDFRDSFARLQKKKLPTRNVVRRYAKQFARAHDLYTKLEAREVGMEPTEWKLHTQEEQTFYWELTKAIFIILYRFHTETEELSSRRAFMETFYY